MGILSSTQLHNFRLSNLEIEFNDDWIWAEEEERGQESYDISPDTEVFWSDDGNALIMLAVTCLASPSASGLSRFRQVRAVGWGILTFEDDVDQEEREHRAYINGPVILHGMLRGVIASATGTCVGGPFILPTLNYMEVFKRKAEQLELPAFEEEIISNEEPVENGQID